MNTKAIPIDRAREALRPALAQAAPPARPAASKGVALPDVIAMFRRRWKLFGAVLAGVVILTVAATLLVEPKYTAEVELKIDPNQKSVVDAQQGPRPDQVATAFVDTEIQLARSRKVAEAVVAQLNLTNDPEFNQGSAGSPLDRTVDAVLDRFDVTRQGTTYMVELAFTSSDPQKAAQIANAFANAYISESVKLRLETIEAQTQALEAGLRKLEVDARAADEAAANYRAATGLVDASAGATITQQQASSIAAQLSSAEADLATARSTLEAARTLGQGGEAGSVSSVLGSPVIQDLRRQRAEVMREYGDISARYGPKHPSFVTVQQQLQELDRQISDESARVMESLEADARAAEARVASLRSTLGGLQGRLNASSRTRAQAESLEREAEAKENIYNQYNLAQQQATQQKNLSGAQGVVVSEAMAPRAPSFPNKPLFGILGGVVGLVLASAVVLLAEMLDSRLTSGREVEEALGHPFLASIPMLSEKALRHGGRKLTPDSYVLAKPLSAFAEAFRTIRSALVLGQPAGAVKVIALTSALPGEGKTCTTLAFARVLGMGGSRVAVLDCDLRRSTLGGLTRGAVSAGLVEVLTGLAPLSEALVADEVENVSILPLSGANLTPRDLFGSEAFAQLLALLRSRYDYVLMDTPPVLAVADARALARQADTVVMLCRWSSTPKAAAAAAVGLLEQDGATIGGVALTRVNLSAKAYLGADEASYYYEKYRKYYQS